MADSLYAKLSDQRLNVFLTVLCLCVFQRWQHCDCVRASGKEEHYLCDRCEPRYYDPVS